MSGAVRLQSGVPFSVSVSALQNLGSFVPQRANFASGREDDKGEIGELTEMPYLGVTAAAVVRSRRPTLDPAAGFQGTAGRNTLRGPVLSAVWMWRSPSGSRSTAPGRYGIPRRGLQPPQHDELRDACCRTSRTRTPAPITTADDARNAQLSVRVVW